VPKIAALVAGTWECSETIARCRPWSAARRAKPSFAKVRPWVLMSDRPEAGMDGRLAARHDRTAEAMAVQEVGALEQLLGRMEEEGGLSGVAAHGAIVVALLPEAEESGALRGDRLGVRDLLLEEAETGRPR
jgi:hypothetical protein